MLSKLYHKILKTKKIDYKNESIINCNSNTRPQIKWTF